MLWTKAKRLGRRYPSAAFKTFWAPVAKPSNVLTLAVGLVSTALLIQLGAIPRVVEELRSWEIWAQAVGYVGIAWAVISLLIAPWLIVADDRTRGRWFGNRFVYHEPLLVAVFRCKPTGNIEMHRCEFRDAEPGSFIYFSIELDWGHNLAEIGLGGTVHSGPIPYKNWPGTGGVLLPRSREAIFQIRLPTNALSITARVFCRNFVIGEHNEQDGTTGDLAVRRILERNPEVGKPPA